MKICLVEGCGKKHYAKGFCRKHYNAQYHLRWYAVPKNKIKRSVYIEQWYSNQDNKEKEKLKRAVYRAVPKNRNKAAQRSKEWYDNPDNKIKRKVYQSRPEVKAKDNKHRSCRKKTDISFKIKCVLRSRLNKAVRGNQKSGSAIRDMGCTVEFLKKWLESQFESWMNWDNWKLKPTKEHPRVWHVDHKIPLSTLSGLTGKALREQILIVCHYTNLQPLEAIDNIKKGSKLLS